MNLLLVDSVDFPFGGAHSVHVSLVIKGLRENGENAILIIPYGNKREVIASSKMKYGHFDGVPFYFVRRHDSKKKIYQLFHVIIGVLKTAFLIRDRKKKNKLDAIILGGADVLRHFPIILICSLYKIPLYGWRVEKGTLAEDIRGFSGFLNYQGQKLTEKYLARFCTGIIVISTFIKKHYLKYLPEKKILINPILVSNDTFKVVKTSDIELIKSKFGEKLKDKRILVYSGSFGEKDGVYYLIDAFKKVLEKFPDTIFVMTGKSRDNSVMNEVVQYVENSSVKEKIMLVGFLNSEDLLSYTYAADILFVCRTNSAYANHGFPWKLGEYCMTGRPVIATRVGDIEEYFKDNEDLYIVEPNNSDAIAEKIGFIFNNYPKAVTVANQGRITATKCFGYLERTQDIINFIKDNSDPKVVNN